MSNNELTDSAKNVIARAANWNFEGDCMILQWMEQISQTLETKAKNTLHSLDALNNNINRAQIDLENTQNSLTALQYSQYVEMRCQDDSMLETLAENATSLAERQQKPAAPPNRQEILQTFLQNNMKMLNNCHDKFNFLEDSDDDDEPIGSAAAENCIYQPRNPYNERLLPHIYGTKEWKENSHVGLEDDEALDNAAHDEKSEVYSISSSSSATSSNERESVESHITTANNSQWTSSASLNNEFIESSKINKATPSISSTPSLASLPTVANKVSTSAESKPATATETVLPTSTILPVSSSNAYKPILNLFDDNDYKKLVAEVKNKTESLASSKATGAIQKPAARVKNSLFEDDDVPLPKQQATKEASLSKIPTKNLFDNPNEDLFADLPTPSTNVTQKSEAANFFKTKLSSKNLFDDDDDLDTDFFNSLVNKPAHTYDDSSKDHKQKPAAPLFDGRDELDRQAEVLNQQKSLQINQNVETQKISAAVKPKKSLFFDDDDDQDFFEKLQETLPQKSKALSQPAPFMSEEPPLDFSDKKGELNKIQQKNLPAEVYDNEDDDFQQMFRGTKPNISDRKISVNDNALNDTKFVDASKETENNDEHESNFRSKANHETANKTAITPSVQKLTDSHDELKKDYSEIEALPAKEIISETIKTQTPLPFQADIRNSYGASAWTTEPPLDEPQEIVKSPTQVPASLQADVKSSHDAFTTESKLDEPQETVKVKSAVDFSLDDADDDEDDFLSAFKKTKPVLVVPIAPKPSDKVEITDIPNTKSDLESNKITTSVNEPQIEAQQALTAQEIEATKDKFTDPQDKEALSSTIMVESPKLEDQTEATDANNVVDNQKKKTPLFDHFSPLFLDEPPDDDDDDFLQTISGSSGSQMMPSTQYGIDNDFYEPTKHEQSITTEKTTETKQNQQEIPHTASYNIQLFDEMPPEDNLQAPPPNMATKPNKLSDLFATDEVKSRLVVEKTEQVLENNQTSADKIVAKQTISKLKLPKIDINVQALLPNAGKNLVKPKENLEKSASDVTKEVGRVEISKPIAKSYEQQEDNVHLLPSLCKSRVRGPVKRKSSTRAGRQESYRQSLQAEIANSNASADVDTLKTAKNEKENQQQTSPKLPTSSQLKVTKPKDQEEKENLITTTPIPSIPTTKTISASITTTTLPTVQTKQATDSVPTTKIQSVLTETYSSKEHEPRKNMQSTATKSSLSAIKQAPPQQKSLSTIKAAKLFFDSGSENDDNDDDFFGKLAQPKLPTGSNDKPILTSKPLHESDDDDLFAKNVSESRVLDKSTTHKPEPLPTPNAKPSVGSSLKPHRSARIFDSSDSNEEDSAEDLFKPLSKSFKPSTTQTTMQKSSKPNISSSEFKKLSTTKTTKSLFSDCDDDEDDDDLFGSSVSKSKSTRVDSTQTAKTSLVSIQKQPAVAKKSTEKSADNPLADLLG